VQYWLVMPAAGSGRRFGGPVPKQYLPLAGRCVIEHALAPFLADPRCRGIIVALDAADRGFGALAVAKEPRVRQVAGGLRRCDSVRKALAALQAPADAWVLVHDAARPCLASADLDALLAAVGQDPVGGLLAVPLADTLKRAAGAERVLETPARVGLWRALTPQMFRLGMLREALQAAEAAGREPTDEAQAIEWLGLAPKLVAGSGSNIKVTTPADLPLAAAVLGHGQGGAAMEFRTGSGFDVHAFGPGDHVVLGGVRIAWERGVVAHSDGDVLLHALTDALLGAAGLGDIGQHFPDSDPQWRGADSTRFVQHAVKLLAERGWQVANADLTLLAEAPRINPHRDAIRASLAAALGVAADAVNLKATTTEKLGFVGRSEGLAAQAAVLISRLPAGLPGRNAAT
jgi:2-C-methyl-D-erythritol 4-phosphate cytidylyltransferase/2-C-methyl-D-erythritol 2,4-cyclodiphosphate synthase